MTEQIVGRKTLFFLMSYSVFMLGTLPFLPSFPPLKDPLPQSILLTCWIFATLGAFLALAAKWQVGSKRLWYFVIAASAIGTWGSFFQACYSFAKEAALHPQFPGIGLIWMIPGVGIHAGVLAASIVWLFPTNLIFRQYNPKQSPPSFDASVLTYGFVSSKQQLSMVDKLILVIALSYLCVCLWMIVYEPFVEKLENLPSPITFLLGLPWSPAIYLTFLICPTKLRVPLLWFVYLAPPIMNVYYCLQLRGIRIRIWKLLDILMRKLMSKKVQTSNEN